MFNKKGVRKFCRKCWWCDVPSKQKHIYNRTYGRNPVTVSENRKLKFSRWCYNDENKRHNEIISCTLVLIDQQKTKGVAQSKVQGCCCTVHTVKERLAYPLVDSFCRIEIVRCYKDSCNKIFCGIYRFGYRLKKSLFWENHVIVFWTSTACSYTVQLAMHFLYVFLFFQNWHPVNTYKMPDI